MLYILASRWWHLQNDSFKGHGDHIILHGDDIGWMQPSIYHRGLMVGETPNIDRIGNEGAIFMHYYAEQSCTPGATPSSPACIRCAPA